MRQYLGGMVGFAITVTLIVVLAVGAFGLSTPGLTTSQTEAVASPGASPIASPIATSIVQPHATPITTTGSTDAIIEERVRALETRVAVVEERLDTQASGGDASAATPPPTPSGEGGPLIISGTGSIVTEDFPLEAGRYVVTVDVASGCCISLYLYGPSGDETTLFSDIFPGEGGTATDIFQVPESGMYFIDSQSTDADWTVTFENR